MKKVFILALILCTVFTSPVFAKKQDNVQNNIEYMNLTWWKKFNDENLNNNLLKLYEKNYDLKNAALKVKENEQLVKMQFANELPQLSFSGELSRDIRGARQQYGNMMIPNYSQYNYYLPLTAGYEVDIWGTNRLKTKSVKEQLEIVKQAERATYIALTSDFAADYFNLIKADEFLRIQEDLIKAQEDIVSKVSDKYGIGLCSINELLAEERMLTNLREERNKNIKTRDTLISSMLVYLSESGGNIERGNYKNISVLTGIPDKFTTEAVTKRPDFLQEEANIRHIGFDVKVARREFLPKFIIFGQIGLNAYHFDSLFNSASQFFNAGILPSMDLFSGGRKAALLKLKKFEYQEALNSYQKTILNGIKEINTGLIAYNEASENYNESAERLKLQNQTFSLMNDRYSIGAASDLDVLYAKEAYLMISKEEVSNKVNTLISTIGLYKALGGVDLYSLNTNL